MLESPEIKISPSILSADFGRLGEQVAEASKSGADYIHVDIMDGHFVPNLTIGPIIVSGIRPWTELPLDVHLMIEEPDRLIPDFAKAGANILTVHPEACRHLHRVIYQIKDLGVRAGISLNPGTPASVLEPVISGTLTWCLVMTVNPGIRGAEVHSQRDEQDSKGAQRCWTKRGRGQSWRWTVESMPDTASHSCGGRGKGACSWVGGVQRLGHGGRVNRQNSGEPRAGLDCLIQIFVYYRRELVGTLPAYQLCRLSTTRDDEGGLG